jgi:hypothetical protein
MNAPRSSPSAAGITSDLLLLIGGLGLAGTGYAGFLVHVGLTSEEMFAGLGVVLGILIGLPALVAAAGAATCWWIRRRDPDIGRSLTIALGALLVLAAAALGAVTLVPVMLVPLLLGAALVVVAIASPVGPSRSPGAVRDEEGVGWGSIR